MVGPSELVWAEWHEMWWPALVLGRAQDGGHEVQFLGPGSWQDVVQRIEAWDLGIQMELHTKELRRKQYRSDHKTALQHATMWLELTPCGWNARIVESLEDDTLELFLLAPGMALMPPAGPSIPQ